MQSGDIDVTNNALLDENMKTAVCADSTYVRGSIAALTSFQERSNGIRCLWSARDKPRRTRNNDKNDHNACNAYAERNVQPATHNPMTDVSRTHGRDDVSSDNSGRLKGHESLDLNTL